MRDRFHRFIDTIAELRTKLDDPTGYEAYSVAELMKRVMDRRPLSKCRRSKVKESVLILLDNSGSMEWWASLLSRLARLAIMRRDAEIYVAPNGYVEQRVTAHGRQPISHEMFMRTTRQRIIVYVGDYDGADTPIELSQHNRVYWFCPERRYRRFRSHTWVHHDELQYKGMWFRVYDEAEIVHAISIASSPFRRLFIDFHESDEFDDDHDDGVDGR